MKKAHSKKPLKKTRSATAAAGEHEPLTAKHRAQIDRLAAMPDEEIDFSDNPEITNWTGFERSKFYRPVKQQVTLRIDADVLTWFRRHREKGYQTEINRALRAYVTSRERKRAPKRKREVA